MLSSVAKTLVGSNKLAALDAIMAEWTSERDYQTRVTAIRFLTHAGRIRNSYVLSELLCRHGHDQNRRSARPIYPTYFGTSPRGPMRVIEEFAAARFC